MSRRVVSVWFQRLPSERVLRARPTEAPFALSQRQGNTERVYCLNAAASAQGLQKGMGLGEARVLCPGLQTAEAAPEADARFMQVLARWATQYCPWVAIEPDGLALDITGAAHLRGGEGPLLEDISARLARAGLSHRLGLADTYGAAWALARFGQSRAFVGAKIASMPAADTSGKTGLLAKNPGARAASHGSKQPRSAFFLKTHSPIWQARCHPQAAMRPENLPLTTRHLYCNIPPLPCFEPPPYPAHMRRTVPRFRRSRGAISLALVSPSRPRRAAPFAPVRPLEDPCSPFGRSSRRKRRHATMEAGGKIGMANRHKVMPSGYMACRLTFDTVPKPTICSAVKVGYGPYWLRATIWFTVRSFERAYARYRVHALRVSCKSTGQKFTQCCFTSALVFRCGAPEPRRASGSASGASLPAWLGNVARAPRGSACACGRGITSGLAPHQREQQAPRLAGGVGQTLPHEIWVSRRHRAEGAARFGASTPETLGCEIVSVGYNTQLSKPAPHTAGPKGATSWPQSRTSIWCAAPSGFTLGAGHA